MSAYDNDLLAIPCRSCRAGEGERCRYPNGEVRQHLPCLLRLKDRDRTVKV